MKKGFNFSFLVMLCFYLMSSSCSNNDDDGGVIDNSEQIAQVGNTVESGTWRISNFIDSGENETSDFTGYNFSFNSDGSLVAANGTDTLTGTWSVTDDSSSESNIDFNIFFPVPDTNDFEDLNDDWDIISYTSTKIELIDISGGNGGTDNLTLEKN